MLSTPHMESIQLHRYLENWVHVTSGARLQRPSAGSIHMSSTQCFATTSQLGHEPGPASSIGSRWRSLWEMDFPDIFPTSPINHCAPVVHSPARVPVPDAVLRGDRLTPHSGKLKARQPTAIVRRSSAAAGVQCSSAPALAAASSMLGCNGVSKAKTEPSQTQNQAKPTKPKLNQTDNPGSAHTDQTQQWGWHRGMEGPVH
jgi:hypothetical protein